MEGDGSAVKMKPKAVKEKSSFDTLNAVDVSAKIEKKKVGNVELSYLSWAYSWGELKKKHPDATYKVERFEGYPYIYSESLGYMVFTEVTVGDITHPMWLPVLDGANKAMRKAAYTYKVKGWDGKPDIEKTVNAATMFDVNTALMRCLVKNIAMFGLGLYIYAGEDLPEDSQDTSVMGKGDRLVGTSAGSTQMFKTQKERSTHWVKTKELIGSMQKEGDWLELKAVIEESIKIQTEADEQSGMNLQSILDLKLRSLAPF